MCVIISALRKKHLDRTEVVQAMKHNSEGFFMCHWNPRSENPAERNHIRTLLEGEALDFFDAVPDDDVFVMHARIHSHGVVSKDNVHGWEEDGVMFCHNMTMGSLNPLMSAEDWKGTDSEYFFRKLFMPMHRGEHLADPNLPPGEMGPATKRLTALLCGETNKFLFVMPDNTVIRAGKWSTVASEKRTVVEEREVEETIGESVDLDGKVTKKTQKVKKDVPVEYEFATVVASNTYYRPSASYTSCYYGGRRWNADESKWESVGTGASAASATPAAASAPAAAAKTASSAAVKTTAAACRSSYDAYCDPYDDDLPLYYADDFGDFGRSRKPYKSEKRPVREKPKKSELADDDMEKFLKWRTGDSGFKKPVLASEMDIATSVLFKDLSVENGRFSADSIVRLFNVMLRCVVYNNYRDNLEYILAADEGMRAQKDEFGLIVAASEKVVETVIPAEFDDSLATFVLNALSKLSDRLSPSSGEFVLPSEALHAMLSDFVTEFDCSFGESAFAAGVMVDDNAEIENRRNALFASMRATDILLNLSFDPTVKANKDIERYVRAAMVVGRKLRWIHPALLLSADSSMVSSTGGWESSEEQENLLKTLNFVAEACVTGGQSLEAADRRYLSELKSLVVSFDEKGDDEAKAASGTEEAEGEVVDTFVPGETVATGDTPNADGVAILGDPEEAEKSDKDTPPNTGIPEAENKPEDTAAEQPSAAEKDPGEGSSK